MTYKEFLLKCQQANITLTESLGNYYFNLWCDTMIQDCKTSQPHDFATYITWMKKQ